MTRPIRQELQRKVHDFVLKGFHPRFGQRSGGFPSNPTWKRLAGLGTQLWLDTGNIKDARELWTSEFSALTTNNTLLNKEVQAGTYDSLVLQANDLLSDESLDERQKILEIAFILNAYHGLRLVETFDAFVSVEEHTDLANDYDQAVEYARRYQAICPERFIVKIPLTPTGILATRRCSLDGIPVNHTLGFSARQNYLVARIARPEFVNVFLGRLNSFVVENGLGNGQNVGEQATLASQSAIAGLRRSHGVPTRQIGASFRGGGQVRDLAGIDVMTIPPKVAKEFLELGVSVDDLTDRTGETYKLGASPDSIPLARLDTLWRVDSQLELALDALESEELDSFTPEDLTAFLTLHGCGDILVNWTPQQRQISAAEGKIPRLEHWRDALHDKAVGLDALMNLGGLSSFIADQKAMDDRVVSVLAKAHQHA